MSEQKLVSPLLDGFVMGDPMSNHDGVCCCPAMRENSEEKYIVKIVSVPASQRQLDALLLTGAYPDAASATAYFKEVAEGVVKEAELLKQLSRLEGFLAYDNWQIVPMEGTNLGYQIYLISPYKRSLDKYLQRHQMTHLGAVNLGLDLCAALSICRRAGYMHVDLKPTNIYMTGKREFQIGDLGFVKLSTLKYTSLPSKYCSPYTPPELHDALNTLNPTADIYAIGMILYQIYNNGILPYAVKAPAAPLAAPANADSGMAQIILKACDPNPRRRYQTPIEMGKALVEYMKLNKPEDNPIPVIAPPVEVAEPEVAEEPVAPVVEEPEAEVTAPEAAEQIPEVNEEPSSVEEAESVAESVPEASEPAPQKVEEPVQEEYSDDIKALLEQFEGLMTPSESVDELLAKVDKQQANQFYTDDAAEETFRYEQMHAPVAVSSGDEDDDFFEDTAIRHKKRKKRSALGPILLLILLAALAFGGYYYYQNIYLVPISALDITTDKDAVTVNVTTDVDESLLRIVCTDPSGKAATAPLANGTATFTGLAADTIYKIDVVVDGFHSFVGAHSGTIITEQQVTIQNLSAMTGTEDGSAILEFTFDGNNQDWIMEYTTEDEVTQSVSFTGNSVTVDNLTVGKEYTFTLLAAPGADIYINGDNTLVHTASNNITAQQLRVVSFDNNVLTAQWNVPGDAPVDSWNVRLYNGKKYDKTVTVTENTVQFENIKLETGYTMEVTAAGMTESTRIFVSPNPTVISEISVDDSVPGTLTVTWNSNNVIPEGGWLLTYTMGSGRDAMVIKAKENKAVIQPVIPGSTYNLHIQASNESTVFGGVSSYTSAAAPVYNGNSVNGADVTASFCPTPSKSDWTYKDIAAEAYTATYAPGSKVSMVLYSPAKAARSKDDISVMFVIRDSQGNALPQLTNTVTASWNDLWNNRSRYCSLNLPAIPAADGQYTVEVYFNRSLVVTKNLTISTP